MNCGHCERTIRAGESEAWWELVEPREDGWTLNDVRAAAGLPSIVDGDATIDSGDMDPDDPEEWPVVCPDCLYTPNERLAIGEAIVKLPPGAEVEGLAQRLAQRGE